MKPHLFRYVLEGAVPAVNEEGVKQWVMNSISFTAMFGQYVKSMHVGARELTAEDLVQKPRLFDANGVLQ